MSSIIQELAPLYTLNEAKRATGLAYATLLRWVRCGHLPAEKIGRSWVVRREDVHRVAGESERYYGGQRRGGLRTRQGRTTRSVSGHAGNEVETFTGWLLRQRDRGDPVGDLARDALEDRTWPVLAEDHAAFHQHLVLLGAMDLAMEALDRAWDEYEGLLPKRED